MRHRLLKYRIASTFMSAALLTALLASCASGEGSAAGEATGSPQTSASPISVSGYEAKFDEEDLDASWDAAAAVSVRLSGASVSVDGEGASVSGSTVTIRKAGTYVVSGSLNDGQIVVDAGNTDLVRIVLNGANITCSDNAPLYAVKAKKVILILADGTENTMADGGAYALSEGEDEPDGAVFSKTDLTINGGGSLKVKASYLDGIVSKDALKIVSGVIAVTAADDGIRGKDCVAVKNAEITVDAGGDGIKSTEDSDSARGFVFIEDGKFVIAAENDGIQAETALLIENGTFDVVTGGGSENGISAKTGSGTESRKGLKAAVDLAVLGGTFQIDSADDAVHSNGSIVIAGGAFRISSGDDGIHADASISITGGEIEISRCYEGVESAVIIISGGTIRAVCTDDGINVAGGNDLSSMGGRPGQNNFASSGSYYLEISGGSIAVNAGGDGVDSNGSITMSGGTVIIQGPTNSGNGALDYNGSFQMTGGVLVAAGSAGMVQTPGSSSEQASLSITFESAMAAGTLVNIRDESGADLLTFAAEKTIQNIVFSSPDLKDGDTLSIYCGGSATGDSSDGVYTGGVYTPGTLFETVTLSGAVTSVGSGSGGMPGGAAPAGGKTGGNPGGAGGGRR